MTMEINHFLVMIWGNSWFYSFDGNQDKGTWLSFEDAIYIRSWAHLQFDMIVGLSFCSLLCMSYVWYRWCINPKNRDVEMRQIRYRHWRKYCVLQKLFIFFRRSNRRKCVTKVVWSHPPTPKTCLQWYLLTFLCNTRENIHLVKSWVSYILHIFIIITIATSVRTASG